MPNTQVPITMSDLVKDEDLIHFVIEQDVGSDSSAVIDSIDGKGKAQMFLLYQDLHSCGVCNHQLMDITEFLRHKAKHTIGESMYKCELCKRILSTQDQLIDHYEQYHNFALGLSILHPPQKEPLTHMPQPGSKVNQVQVTVVQAKKPEDKRSTDSRKTGFKRSKPAILSSWGRTYREKRKPGRPPKKKAANHNVIIDQNGIHQQEPVHSIMIHADDMKLPLLEHYDEDNTKLDSQEDMNELDIEAEITGEDPEENSVSSGPVVKTERVEEEESVTDTPNANFTFFLVTEVKRGRTVTYERQWLRCIHCEVKSRTKKVLTDHMREMHPEYLDIPPAQLNTCDLVKELERSGLKVAVMEMSAYESMMCSEGKVRRPKVKRPRKMEKQDILGVYPCSQCGKVFSRLRYLRKHTETHRTEKKFVCDTCGKSFKSRAYLRVHKRIHKEKMFKCNQCPFTSNNNASIHIHRQIHSQGSVLCDICGYAYTDKSTLTKHKRVHDTSRPFACNHPGCMWRFKTEIMCKAHIRAHTTEGKFRCMYCGYIFRHKHHLIRHETNIHGVQREKTALNNNSSTASLVADTELEQVTDAQLEANTVGIIISSELGGSDQLHLGQAALVVTTDDQGTPITYEATDISTYEALIQTEGESQEVTGSCIEVDQGQHILVSHPEQEMHF